MSTADWTIAFVLPNLTLKKSLDEDCVSIAPRSDSRVQECVERNDAARHLLDGFTDQFGTKRSVSAMIYRRGVIPQAKLLPALISFRNLFALSCIINGWQCFIGNLNVFWTLFSDYFDCYPWAPGASGEDLVQLGPGQESVRKVSGFRGQTSPDLSQILIEASPDNVILEPLRAVWRRRFTGTTDYGRRTTALFRSLAVAYQAAALPIKNSSWLFDYGTNVALWISAFEILVHPMQNRASLPDVLNFLRKATWIKPELRHRRFKIMYRNRSERVNFVKALYWQLYNARNDFLHGNRVNARDLFVNRNPNLIDLTKVAPVLYGIALRCFFGTYQKRRKGNVIKVALEKIRESSQLERALIALTVPTSDWGGVPP